MTQALGRRPTPGTLATAVLVPPLGLHLFGATPRAFWIGIGLTMLGFVPGVVFALYTVLSRDRQAAIVGG